ncbi:MAG: response regulator [Gemmatimonadota bacterium]|nr:response regulator [Gemmatimonadota bacterium]
MPKPMDPDVPLASRSPPSERPALTITLIYAAVAGVWIVASDEVARRLVTDPTAALQLQTLKGAGFVLVTAAVLYALLRHRGLTLGRSVARLGEHERLLEAIRRAAPVGLVVLGRGGEVVSWNPGAERMLGWHEGDVLGRTLPWRAADDATLPHWLLRARSGERVTDLEGRVQRKDGAWLDVSISAAPLADPADQVLGIVAVFSDLTARKHLEAQLRQAQKMEALGQVTGGIAHDFRNVLTVLITVAEGLRARLPPDDEEVRADVDELLRAAERGSAITQRLLAFSRSEQQLEPRVVDLGRIAQDGASVLRRLLPASIDVVVEAPPEPVPAAVDPNAMTHILTNLGTNARDAMPSGGRLRIHVYHREQPETIAGYVGPLDQAVVEVIDSGTGMDEATRARAFDPFFTTKPAGLGTGLGLPIVQGLVAEQGGVVELESTVAWGTAVRLCFPLTVDALPAPSPAATAPFHGGNETILVVEDEEAIRRSAQRALQQLGYTVIVAADGAEALEALRANPTVDLVISDSIMPRMGGVEFYERLRAEGMTVPFLLASGYTPQEATAGGTRRPEVPFLPKPWSLTDLATAVRATLDG